MYVPLFLIIASILQFSVHFAMQSTKNVKRTLALRSVFYKKDPNVLQYVIMPVLSNTIHKRDG